MKKIILVLNILLLLVLIFSPTFVFADGMIIKPDPNNNRWDYSAESNQQIFINYENGLEKMIVSIGLEDKNNDALWLFPVPAAPQKVVIDVLENLPHLSGEEVAKKAKSQLDDTKKFLQMTQIYTIPFIELFSQASVTTDTKDTLTLGTIGPDENIEQDVMVYEHLEKEGIASEIITAKTANGLYDYLKNQGLKIETGSIPVLDQYIGQDYSFVASWIKPVTQIPVEQSNANISSKSKQPENQKGVFVTFPTEDIYVPLLPTSVYDSKTIPITMRIIGYVSPQIFQNIKSYTKTDYYFDEYANFDSNLKNFYSGTNERIKYTKIDISAPSKYLTEDLWIKNKAPVRTYYSTFVASYPVAIAIILFVLCSIISGIIVGWLVFKELRKNIFKLTLMGLSNCLSIFGVWITTLFMRTKQQDSAPAVLAELKQKGYFWKRKLAAILIIIDLPFLIISIIAMISLISYFEIVVVLFSLIPVLIFIFALFIKRIKKEDKSLFEQLKANNYSSWSFQPRDPMKYAFVPIFSISFLIISWLIVKIIELTV